jgi:long-chain acyl-CoA synthetase
VNYTLLVPVMLNSLINDQAVSRYDLSSVKRCHYGGSPMPEAVLRKAMKVLPSWTFYQGYGLTETSAVLTTLDWRQHALDGPLARKLTSAGQVSPGWELKIANEHGEEVPRGQIGEVTARGAALMSGYWGNEEATRAVIKDGWFRTGDGAYMDEDGFIFIVDRMKDMIISGGENVYSTEVENAIYKHPTVRECAVIGIPDDVWGEAVHAVVVPHQGEKPSADDIIRHCHTLIAGYKCPRSVEITTVPLPTSPTGKITKNVLRERFWSGNERNVH